MRDAIVIGAGPSGLTAALLLAAEGLDVMVLERSAESQPQTPEEAWDSWDRRPVAQFRQAHILLPRGHRLLEQHLPTVLERLREGGGRDWNMVAVRPPTIEDWTDDPADDRFGTVAARRPVIDWAFAGIADEAGIEIRRGTVVDALDADGVGGSVPTVTGVRTADGEEMRARVIIDASGRRAPIPKMLGDAGLPGPIERREDNGFVYYTRFFRSGDGSNPQPMGGLLSPIGSMSLLTLPADNGSWSVTVYGSSADAELRAVRDPEVFHRVVSACPLHAHWLDGKPISEVGVMSSVVDRVYDYRPDGRPLVAGLLAVGDAWACTNPSLGRGISMGIGHAVEAASLIARHIDDPLELSDAFWQATDDNHIPWHEATLQVDRLRAAHIDAFRSGGTAVTDSDDPAQVLASAIFVAAGGSAEMFRAYVELVCALALPEEVFARPGLVERILGFAGVVDPPQAPGPDRRELVELLS